MTNKLFAATAAIALASSAARAEEGMWTFDDLPDRQGRGGLWQSADKAWLDHVQASAVRLTGGCSSSLVSAEGLLLTNNHCVADCVQALSSPQSDLGQERLPRRRQAQGAALPGQQAEILTAVTDVTGDITKAIGSNTGAATRPGARCGDRGAIEKAGCADPTTQRCEVVTLFGGGQLQALQIPQILRRRLVYRAGVPGRLFRRRSGQFQLPALRPRCAFLRIYEKASRSRRPTTCKWNPRAAGARRAGLRRRQSRQHPAPATPRPSSTLRRDRRLAGDRGLSVRTARPADPGDGERSARRRELAPTSCSASRTATRPITASGAHCSIRPSPPSSPTVSRHCAPRSPPIRR